MSAGTIQSSVNNILETTSLMGYLFSKTPGAKRRARIYEEGKDLDAQEKLLKSREEAVEKRYKAGQMEQGDYDEAKKQFAEQKVALSEGRYKLKPSDKTLEAMETARDARDGTYFRHTPQEKSLSSYTPEDIEEKALNLAQDADLAAREADVQEQIYSQVPSQRTYLSRKEIAEEQARVNAQKELAKQQKTKTTRRNFMNYLDKLPTQYGTVADTLPENYKKEAAKLYSSKERKKIMDTMDKGGTI